MPDLYMITAVSASVAGGFGIYLSARCLGLLGRNIGDKIRGYNGLESVVNHIGRFVDGTQEGETLHIARPESGQNPSLFDTYVVQQAIDAAKARRVVFVEKTSLVPGFGVITGPWGVTEVYTDKVTGQRARYFARYFNGSAAPAIVSAWNRRIEALPSKA